MRIDSNPFLDRVKTRFDQESVDSFIDDGASSETSQPQSQSSTNSTKVEIESDGASTSSSAKGSSSSSLSIEEKDRLKNACSNRPNYLKGTSSSEVKKIKNQASDPLDYDSSTGSNDRLKSDLRNTEPKSRSTFSSLKPTHNFKRNTSLRTLRILINKPNKSSCEKSCPEVCEGVGVIRPTCSSTLKDSKFPVVEIEPEERESEKVSTLKVCRYTYCSIHGSHHHPPVPTLKRLLSRKRRSLKGTRVRNENYDGDSIKDVEKRDMVVNDDSKGRKKGKSGKVVLPSKNKEKGSSLPAQIDCKNDESMQDSRATMDCDEMAKSGELRGSDKISILGNKKKKQMSMWYLIHQQMVLGLAEESKRETFEKGNEEVTKVDDTNRLLGSQTSKNFSSFSDSSENTCVEDQKTETQEMEIQKLHAVKMVREAIERILLPEVPDQSPDDVSICSDAASKQDPSENSNPSEDLERGETVINEEEKTKSKAPKSWSNLKKLILLKRFVKELEKVRKISPLKPQLLPEQEGQNVSLRSKRLDKKKSTEEWMLDYALQQAVSELAPTQKRKVEVLIRAFETVAPTSDGEQSPMSFSKLKGKYEDEKSIVGNEDSKVLLGEKADQEKLNDDVIINQNEESSVVNDDTSLVFDSGKDEQVTRAEEVETEDVGSRETISTMTNRDFTFTESNVEKPKIEEPTNSDPMHEDKSTLDDESKEIGSTVASRAEDGTQQAFKTKFRKPKNNSMWNLIHQQMVAGLKDEGKTKENENETESEDNAINANIESENNDMESQEIELRKVFAIKMVREAIEKILLPEVQDQSSDDQSTTSEIETISDQELLEKNQEEDWGSNIFNSVGFTDKIPVNCSNNKVMYDTLLSQEEAMYNYPQNSKPIEAKTELKVEKKPEKKAPKRWSNLKKWIVLQRFVKELEKVKDFNPKKPQLLPLKLDPEAEAVKLRNQMMNEKRSSEEWMLDYALRKVVSELAPKEKRKVELLVKAFETVVPPQEDMKSPRDFPRLESTSRESSYIESKELIEKIIIVETKIDTVNKSGAADENIEVSTRDEPGESTSSYMVTSSTSGSNLLDKFRAKKEILNNDSETKSIEKLTNNAHLDKQKHMKMWHLLCQHVVSDIAVKVEIQQLDKEDDDESRTISPHLDKNEDRALKFSSSDAVKLVRKAIEEILVPDIQEDRDISPDQELLEEKKQPRNWDKLKKLILLKRSIKALEKARKIKVKEEKEVELKNRSSNERKKAEEWMLDYAVQHIVSKLTPDRKRRVSMLVEAFEAVIPIPQV